MWILFGTPEQSVFAARRVAEEGGDEENGEDSGDEEEKDDEDNKMDVTANAGENSNTPPIFTLFSAPASIQPLFTNLSNIALLRLFNDVSIDNAPSLPPDMKRISPPSSLIDKDGLQEIYSGKLLWVYDARSNVDQAVRVVSQKGSGYGTAT